MDKNETTEQIIGASIDVHRIVGPGLLESVYEECLTQLLTYLRLTNMRVGLLINFNVPTLKLGIKRMVNGFSSVPPRLCGGG